MYPLDAIYGPRAYRTFIREKAFDGNLKSTRQSPKEIRVDEPLSARSYTELVDVISFLSIMNKRHTLYFRGQTKEWDLIPATFRPSWTSLSGAPHALPGTPSALRAIWAHLNEQIASIVLAVCDKLPMPRRATLRMFREAIWAVAQHYELWPTPLIDITPNLRTAASFALWGGEASGYLYVAALPASTNSVTFDADQHVVLARLQAVCPPVAKRPHYQDGYLAGRFPFMSPDSNTIDKDPANVSNLSRRLVARIILTDADDEASRRGRRPSGRGFWSDDFPRMSVPSLMPEAKDDQLLDGFSRYADQINDSMHRICRS
jgi:hypothetical protein